jgi:glutaminyl-peptide cyclotransferase
MRPRLRSSAAVVILLAAGCGRGAPEGPPPPEFHEGRAFAYLGQQVAFGPRYAHSRGSERQRAWLVDELRFRADTVEEDRFTFPGEGEETLRGTNVLARFSPDAEARVLLVAHRDTRRRADGSLEPLDRRFPVPGANVNASGVAVLMELSVLLRQQPAPVGVDLLFTDADEYAADRRLVGIRAFLAARPDYRARYAVVLQAVGEIDARIPLDAGSLRSAPAPTGRLWAAAGALGLGSVFVADTAPALEGQAAVLEAAGIPTVVVSDREYGIGNFAWQSVEDRVERTSGESLSAVGRAVTHLVYGEAPPGS